MRKLIFPAFLLGALALLSFTTMPGGGVTRLGKMLYQVAPDSRMQEADKQAVIGILKATYNVRDLQGARELPLQPVPLQGKKGTKANWVVNKKAFVTAIDEKAIKYDVIKEGETLDDADPNYSRLNAILSKYADAK